MSATVQLSLVPTFNLRIDPPILSVLDNTDYSTINPSYSSIKGILEVIAPNNLVIYRNINYEFPDFTISTKTKSGIILPRDSRGNVIQGVYSIFFQVLVDGVYHYNNYTFNYTYTRVIPSLELTVDGYNSTFTSLDNTNYGAYTINTITRTHSVTPPSGSPLSTQTKGLNTGVADTIFYSPNIWSGIWVSSINANVDYLINSIIVKDTIVDTISIPAYNINMDTVNTWYSIYYNGYINDGNKKTKAEKAIIINDVNSLLEQYRFNVDYVHYLLAYENAYQIVQLLNPTLTGTQEIVPFINPGGGGQPPIDDKWSRISSVLSPRVITDKFAINATSTIGSEIANFNGIVRILGLNLGDGSGSESITVDTNGNLVFKDAVTGQKTLAELIDGGWNPSKKTLLETYTQSESNLASAVSLKHSAVTLASNSVLTLSGQIIDIKVANISQSGYLRYQDFITFNNKQDSNAILTSLAGLTFTSGDIIYSTGGSNFAVLHKGSTGQILTIGANYPYWQTINTGISGSNKQVIFNDGGSAYSGSNDLTFDKTTGLFYAKFLSSNSITFPGVSNNINWDGTNLNIQANGNTISLQSNGVRLTGIPYYSSEPTLNNDMQLVYKKYVDSKLSGNYINGIIKDITGNIYLGGTTDGTSINVTGSSSFHFETIKAVTSNNVKNYLDISGLNSSILEIGQTTNYSLGIKSTSLQILQSGVQINYSDSYSSQSAQINFGFGGIYYKSDYSVINNNINNDLWIPNNKYIKTLIQTPTDNILKYDLVNKYYRPYVDTESTNNVFYTGATLPTSNSVLNYGGYLLATKLLTPQGEAITTTTPEFQINVTAPNDRDVMVYDGATGNIINTPISTLLPQTQVCPQGITYINLGSSSSKVGYNVMYTAVRGVSRIIMDTVRMLNNGSTVTPPLSSGLISLPNNGTEDCGITLNSRIYSGQVQLIITVDTSDLTNVVFKYWLWTL